MVSTTGIPEEFHPLVREWFAERYGHATAVQSQTWRAALSGAHLLAVAPTGSGKTLAAFLGAISRFATGEYSPESLCVLYISPLKALNEDIRRNLEAPLADLQRFAAGRAATRSAASGQAVADSVPSVFPAISVATRSGDTPESERRRFLKHPPSILCTTPETFSILLDSPRARPILSSVRLLVLDEIHALAGTKRGSLLACSIGRLAMLAGEFQRIALSATVKPLDRVARYVGGFTMESGSGPEPLYIPRPVATISPAMEKRVEFSVEWPPQAAFGAPLAADSESLRSFPSGRGRGSAGNAPASAHSLPDTSRYAAIVPAILERVNRNRSTLVFCDSRRQAERLSFLLNESGGEGTAYAHHGSLSRELRRMVESRLKSGALRCVVATASLELGIDVGSVDEVILAGSPPGISVALQRAGRSGHSVGEISRARLFPFHGLDLLWAAAVVEGAKSGDVEETIPPANPLDVLAQVLLALIVEEARAADALYGIVKCFPPFADLGRPAFDSVIQLLCGRYADSRIRELEPRVHSDPVDGKLHARDGMRMLLYSSGGSIPDRGPYAMRLKGSGTKIGELDEEFVWERKAGDSFTFGSQSWRIVGIEAEAVEVVALGRGADFMPFWRGGGPGKSGKLSARLKGLVDRLSALESGARETLLVAAYGFSADAAREASRFLAAQKASQGSVPLPGPENLAIEICEEGTREDSRSVVVLHTLLGTRMNQSLAMALAVAWEKSRGQVLESVVDDEGIGFFLPRGRDGPEGMAEGLESLLRSLGDPSHAGLDVPGHAVSFIRSRLESSGIFAAQFRENAGRSLLLPRGMPGSRKPLWLTRLRARRLYEAVGAYPDFPVIAETWRSCLAEFFDFDGLSAWLANIARGRIAIGVFRAFSPSPFAAGALYGTTGRQLYKGDDLGDRPSSLSDRAIAEALGSSRLRPRLDRRLVEDFVARRKRLLPGWAPDSLPELAAWIEERVLVPKDEMPALMASLPPELGAQLSRDPTLGARIEELSLPGATMPSFVHVSRAGSLREDPAALLAEWLRREGAVSPGRIGAIFGLPEAKVLELAASFVEEGTAVFDRIVDGSEESLLVDTDNLEILLRLARKNARPLVEARPGEDLFRLVAAVQGLGNRAGPKTAEDLASVLDGLEGYPAPAWLWESDILPARVGDFPPSRLDALLSDGSRLWFGAGRGLVAFCPAWDWELFQTVGTASPDSPSAGSGGGAAGVSGSILSAFGTPGEFLDFWTIHDHVRLGIGETVRAIWKDVWEGKISSEGFEALREGLRTRFGLDLPGIGGKAADPGRSGGGAADPGFAGSGNQRRMPEALRAKAAMRRFRGPGSPQSGRWFSLSGGEDHETPSGDILDEEDALRDRVRILAVRYGILTRSLLERESPGFGWKRLFPAIRRMELGGELLYGRYFDGIEGPQFMSPRALDLFMNLDSLAAAAPYWISALDPASPAGFPFEVRPLLAPARSESNRLCMLAGRIVALLSRSGKELDITLDPGDPALPGLVAGIVSFRERLKAGRQSGGSWGGKIAIERMNGEPAGLSPYSAAMEASGFDRDRGKLILW
jgi:ATP-dependent Lhr-like helicase